MRFIGKHCQFHPGVFQCIEHLPDALVRYYMICAVGIKYTSVYFHRLFDPFFGIGSRCRQCFFHQHPGAFPTNILHCSSVIFGSFISQSDSFTEKVMRIQRICQCPIQIKYTSFIHRFPLPPCKIKDVRVKKGPKNHTVVKPILPLHAPPVIYNSMTLWKFQYKNVIIFQADSGALF